MGFRMKLPFPPNPDYGDGLVRRIVSLNNIDGCLVEAHLVDNYHEMRCRVRHNGSIVTGVDGEMIRFPTTACPGAPLVAAELAGLRLDAPTRELYNRTLVRRNCTHLFDIVVLAMKHALRKETARCYITEVPDEDCEPVEINIRSNNHMIHKWLVQRGNIIKPEILYGLPILEGFAKWSAQYFVGEELEAGLILSKACFIALIRRYQPEAGHGWPISANTQLIGACHAYSPGQVKTARLIGNPSAVPG